VYGGRRWYTMKRVKVLCCPTPPMSDRALLSDLRSSGVLVVSYRCCVTPYRSHHQSQEVPWKFAGFTRISFCWVVLRWRWVWSIGGMKSTVVHQKLTLIGARLDPGLYGDWQATNRPSRGTANLKTITNRNCI
jgi:hypothetical protein